MIMLMLHIQMLVLYTRYKTKLFEFYIVKAIFFTLDNLQQVCKLVSYAYRVYLLYELKTLRDNTSTHLTEK